MPFQAWPANGPEHLGAKSSTKTRILLPLLLTFRGGPACALGHVSRATTDSPQNVGLQRPLKMQKARPGNDEHKRVYCRVDDRRLSERRATSQFDDAEHH